MNESLPLNYNFKFVIDEISNINDKAQVGRDVPDSLQYVFLPLALLRIQIGLVMARAAQIPTCQLP